MKTGGSSIHCMSNFKKTILQYNLMNTKVYVFTIPTSVESCQLCTCHGLQWFPRANSGESLVSIA